MLDLIEEAVLLQAFLERQGWPFCFIGGIAVQHWGEPRLTRDLDVSLLTGFRGEEEYVDRLLAAYAPRIPGARDFALQRRVLLLLTAAGTGIDVSLGGLPFEESAVARADNIEILPGSFLRLCTAEDLTVMKVFAGRETDVRDVRSILTRQHGRLDWRYMERHLTELGDLKGDPDLVQYLRRLAKEIDS